MTKLSEGKLVKAAKNKVTLGSALSYSAAFVGTNMLFPGDFWQNALSSVAFEAARIGTKKYGTLKSFAAGTAASIAFSALWYGTKGQANDIAVKEAVGGLRFSGIDDAYNTIQGLEDSGMRQPIRQSLTEFGSGYQGPNPWLNPEYNKAEDIERYKIMRASKLGLSESELYEYFTTKEEPSEYLAATASTGAALHLLEEAEAVKSKRVLSAEELVYDPQAMITGHIDMTYLSGAPVDIKTVSAKRFEQVQQKGAFSRHIHQLNWYMNQKNAQTGYLEYINRDDISQKLTLEVNYNSAMYEKDMQKVTRVRRRVEREIEAGILNKALLPKTASLETLQAAAMQEAGEIQKNIERIPYLKNVYKQEAQYLNTVTARRSQQNAQKQYQAAKDKLAQGGQRISGKDDNYNTIEGLRHGGVAESIRKSLTAFGSGFDILKSFFQDKTIQEGKNIVFDKVVKQYASGYSVIDGLHPGGSGLGTHSVQSLSDFGSGWDPLKSLARRTFKDLDESKAFLKLIDLPEFKTALESATPKGIIGEGMFGSVTKMEAAFRGEKFSFARKIGEIGEQEVSAMKAVQGLISPSVYSSKAGQIDMELFSGKTLGELSQTEISGLGEKVSDAFSIVNKAGFEHADPHLGNVFLTEAGDIGIIDFGNAKTFSATSTKPVSGDISTISQLINNKVSGQSQLAALDPFAAQDTFANQNVNLADVFDQLPPGNSLTTNKNDIDFDLMSFNQIEGIHPNASKNLKDSSSGGVSSIQELTDFGSGWDPLKSLVRNEEFINVLKAGKKLKTLGKGQYGKASLYEATLEGKTFKYVMKQSKKGKEEELLKEFKALSDISGEIIPSAYGLSGNKLFMEYMPGKTIKGMTRDTMPKEALKAIQGQISDVAKKGYINIDIHSGNVLYDPATRRTSWIDFGLAAKEEEWKKLVHSPVLKATSAEDLMTNAFISHTTPKEQNPGIIKSILDKIRNKRIKKFRQVSTDAVGIGHRAAHNAGRKHSGFRSTEPVDV